MARIRPEDLKVTVSGVVRNRDAKGNVTSEEKVVEVFEGHKGFIEDRRDYVGTYHIQIYGLNPTASGLKEDGVTHGVIAEGGSMAKED